MDFALSKMQKLLVDSAKDFLEKEGVLELTREVEKTTIGYSPELWQGMAELGWMGMNLPEKYGGVEGDFLEFVLLLEAMGRVLVPGPYIPTMISGYALLEYGSETQRKNLLPALIKGELILSPALIWLEAATGAGDNQEKAIRKEGGYRLSGTRLFVPFGHVCDWLVYGAETEEGRTLFLIDTKDPSVDCRPLDAIDGSKPCEINLREAWVSRDNILGRPGQGGEIVTKMNDWGALAQSAYIAGMLDKILEMTVKHAKQREQFGKPIGSFQAIQHQCADMVTEIDKVKFLTYQAAWLLGDGQPASKEISMAKALASDASRNVSVLGIKIHGGIGITEEYDLQLYFRRAKASELTFGDGDFHRDRVATALGL